MAENQAENDAIEDRLRRSFQHVLWLGSRDADTSKWYAEELAKIAVREVAALQADVEAIANDLRDAREGLQPGSMARVGLDIAETRLRELLPTISPAVGNDGMTDAERADSLAQFEQGIGSRVISPVGGDS